MNKLKESMLIYTLLELVRKSINKTQFQFALSFLRELKVNITGVFS